MAIKAVDLRRGMAVNYNNGIWVCVDNQKVAKGNWRSYQVIQLKNVATGQLIEDRFRTDEGFEQAMMESRQAEYLYSDASSHIMMDQQTFDQVYVPKEIVGDNEKYLTANLQVTIGYVNGELASVEFPNTVELKVVDTPPAVKGATATNQMKEATCEGGARIKVPPFVENGTVVKVDTRTGEYLGRA